MERRDCVTCVELFLRLPWLSTHFANIHHLWHQPGGIIGESELFEFSLFVQVIHYFKCCFQRCVMVRRMEVKNLGCISILEHYGWNVSNLDTRGLESSQTGLHLTPDTLLTEILLVPWVDLVVYEPPPARASRPSLPTGSRTCRRCTSGPCPGGGSSGQSWGRPQSFHEARCRCRDLGRTPLSRGQYQALDDPSFLIWKKFTCLILLLLFVWYAVSSFRMFSINCGMWSVKPVHAFNFTSWDGSFISFISI